ncbi:MAG TPA: RnfABCDGE type electron transport complex subunit D [Bacillota bacterium]|nr:RnfABCDGE type electron transport complex subunit D [Bacillota bacterium]
MNKLTVSSSPHISSKGSVSRIMLDVVIALIPAGIASVYFFGLRTLWVISLAIISAVLTEALIQRFTKKPVTINDFSAVVTGLLLAYNLPPTAPWWLPVIGSFIAIALVKQVFGGLGSNFMNPALASRAILLAAWPVHMTTWIIPNVDAVGTATPLETLDYMTGINTTISGATEVVSDPLPSLFNSFIGNIGGTIGEISTLALLIGAIYLLTRHVISWHIPLTYIATTFILTSLLSGNGLEGGLYHVILGGLILGAFYMATDYSSSPITAKGKIIMGIGCGVMTSVIRLYGGYPEGVSYSILLMNIATPLIDKFTRPRTFGEVKRHA